MAEIGVSIQHDANHGAYSRNTVLEYMLGTTLDIIGASSFMWKQQHVVGHHTYTNVDGLDPDIRVKDPDVRRVSQHQPWQAYQVSYAVSSICRLFCGWHSLGVLTAQAESARPVDLRNVLFWCCTGPRQCHCACVWILVRFTYVRNGVAWVL